MSVSIASRAYAAGGETGNLKAKDDTLVAQEAALLEKVNLGSVTARNIPVVMDPSESAPPPSEARIAPPSVEEVRVARLNEIGADDDLSLNGSNPTETGAVAKAKLDLSKTPLDGAPLPDRKSLQIPLPPEVGGGTVSHETKPVAALAPKAADPVVNVSVKRDVKAPKVAAPAIKPADKAAPTSEPGLDKNELVSRLQNAHERNTKLLESLDDARRRLMLAEMEIERLSNIIESRGGARLAAEAPRRGSAGAPGVTSRGSDQRIERTTVYGSNQRSTVNSSYGNSYGRQGASYPQASYGSARPNEAAVRGVSDVNAAGAPPGEMTVATVTALKANLRAAPGLDNSPLMTVPQGTRLAIERREGNWYRVIAPNGSRAWVTGEVLTFGSRADGSSAPLMRINSFDTKAEDTAFENLNRGVRKK